MIRKLINKLFGKKEAPMELPGAAPIAMRARLQEKSRVQAVTIRAIQSDASPRTGQPARRVTRNEVSTRATARPVQRDDDFYATTFHPIHQSYASVREHQPSYSVPSRDEDDRRASACSSNYTGSSYSSSYDSSCSSSSDSGSSSSCSSSCD